MQHACKLDPNGGEDELKVAFVLEVSGAEEGSTEKPVRECPVRDRLGNGGLSRSCEPVQPVDGGSATVACP